MKNLHGVKFYSFQHSKCSGGSVKFRLIIWMITFEFASS